MLWGRRAVKLTETWFYTSREPAVSHTFWSNNGKPFGHFAIQDQGMVDPFVPTAGCGRHSWPRSFQITSQLGLGQANSSKPTIKMSLGAGHLRGCTSALLSTRAIAH